MTKEIHFHLDFSYDPYHTFKTYDGTNWAIERGKEYCPKGCVIVSTYAKCFGIKFRIFWLSYYKPIRLEKYAQVFNIFNLHIGWEKMYRDVMDEVVYRP